MKLHALKKSHSNCDVSITASVHYYSFLAQQTGKSQRLIFYFVNRKLNIRYSTAQL